MPLSHSISRATLIAAFAASSGTTVAQDAPRAAAPDASARAMAAMRDDARALADKARQAGALDTTPPVLHVIKVSGRIDAQAVHQFISAGIDLSDDLSGIQRYAVSFRSPSGKQAVVRIGEPAMPAKKVSGTLTIGTMQFADIPLTEFAEPGRWHADLFYAYDANGNFAGYSDNELQQLGSTSFEVVNDHYDIVAPKLAGGTIATPHVRLSKPPKGTPAGTLPYTGAQIQMTDSGNGAVSGVYSARMIFCAKDCAHSFSISGLANRTGLDAATVTIGAELGAQQQPGSYQPFALILDDVAGNESEYDSVAFGGETDFGDYFPDGFTITIDR